MFDNLIGQEELRSLLAGDIEGERLPPSLLLSGPPASGKLTAALELARVLSCEGEPRGLWSCPCPSCARHRSLAHPDLLLLGRRSFPEEIPAALDTLRAAPNKAGAFFFVRAVRKLEKRFEPALWEGEETKLAKAAPLVAELEERLGPLDPASASSLFAAEMGETARTAAFKAAGEVVATAAKLEALVPDMPPVAQVRSAEWWARLAPWGRRKTLVIENAEAMNESARNALLKILEEPPPSATFVLLSSRRQAMMRTILSRVRTYSLVERGAEASREVLAKVFRAEAARLEGSGPAVLSPARWLASMRAFPPERARELGEELLSALLAERLRAGRGLGEEFRERAEAARGEGRLLGSVLPALLAATKDLGQKDEAYAGSFEALLGALEEDLGSALRGPGLLASDLDWMAAGAELLREARQRREAFNLPAPTLLESLCYKLRDLGPLPGLGSGPEAGRAGGRRAAAAERGRP